MALGAFTCLAADSAPAPAVQQPAHFKLASRILVGQAPGSVALADLNGDGNLDIIAANEQANNLTVLLGNGTGRFVEAPGSPVAAGNMPNDIAWGRFDGDAALDIAVANHDADYLTVLLGDRGGSFRKVGSVPTATGSAPTQLAAGDLDADGRDDIAVSNMNSGTVTIARLDSSGRVVMVENVPVGRLPKGIAVGDLNGDEKPDLVVANNGDNDIAIILAQ